MGALERLQRWYEDQCNGEWEHSYGVEIGTLDNPGWFVKVDLTGTALEATQFTPVEKLAPEREWVSCKVQGRKFEGHGGPDQLQEILRVFLEWASQNGWTPSENNPVNRV